MPRIAYVSKRLGAAVLAVVEQANAIIEDYRAQGYELTLRQLYYQFVSRGLLPNTPKDYKRLGDIVSDGRLAGLIDWLAIVDRTRNLRALSHWRSPSEIVEVCAAQFRVDKWARQPSYVEVWVEKEALAGVVERACTPLDVPFFCCRGYTSQSEMWAAAQRLREQEDARDGEVVVLHFGDHDPSGVDMSRDIADRLALFGSRARVRRIALTMPQIRRSDGEKILAHEAAHALVTLVHTPAGVAQSSCKGCPSYDPNKSPEYNAAKPGWEGVPGLFEAAAWIAAQPAGSR